MRINKSRFVALVLLVGLISLGFFREFFFVSLNKIIDSKVDPVIANSSNLYSFFSLFDQTSLPLIKWLATLIFIFFFGALTALGIRFYFRNSNYTKLTLVLYLIFLTISVIVYSFGILFSNQEVFYPFSRTVAGLLQSPVPALILFSGFYIHNKQS